MSESPVAALLRQLGPSADRVRVLTHEYRTKLSRAMRQRDETIVAAARAGISIPEIARIAGISAVRTKQIVAEDKWR